MNKIEEKEQSVTTIFSSTVLYTMLPDVSAFIKGRHQVRYI